LRPETLLRWLKGAHTRWPGSESQYGLPVLLSLTYAFLRLLLDLLLVRCSASRVRHAELLALRHEVRVRRRQTKRFAWRSGDRLIVAALSRCLPRPAWHVFPVRPETVVRWHRHAWRLLWRWRSRTRLGRPRLSPDVRELIAAIARDTPLRGTERVRGELLKLGIAVSTRSIRRYRRRGPVRPPSQTWRTFLRNHAHAIWAADLLAVHTLTFKTLYVLLFITHGRRELVHLAVTVHPTAAWVWRQLVEATPWGERPTHRIRDRDAVSGRDFPARAEALGVETVRTPVRSPRATALAARVIGTLRREGLDQLHALGYTVALTEQAA
jgi:hypothetical protein